MRGVLRARLFAGLLLVCAPVAQGIFPREASASVSIAVTFDGLLHESAAAAVGTAAEQRSVWENGRIYTYTRLGVDRAIAGSLRAGDQIWVRTMGGIVGKVGHVVDGEAVFTVGRQTLVFVHAGPTGAYEVTARAQGQFPVVVNDKNETRTIKSFHVGVLLPPSNTSRVGNALVITAPPLLATTLVHGRLLDEVAADVSAAWSRTHGT